MKLMQCLLAATVLAASAPVWAQEDYDAANELGEVVVTGSRKQAAYYVEERPVVGLRRQANSAVRMISIVSDSREEDMRRREVEAMLLAAIDRAKGAGLTLVTGNLELVEVTRANYRDLIFGQTVSSDDDDDYDDDNYDDDRSQPKATFEDDGQTAAIRLMVKARLAGSVGGAQERIAGFVKSVPATGRSQIEQQGSLTLTIVNPDQYRDEILTRVAAAAKHHAGFFGADYGVEVSGLDKDIKWAQVSNTEVFLYIPYSFSISRE